MKKIMLFLSIVCFLITCSDNESSRVYVDTAVSIKYLNKEGGNLFEIDNSYNKSNITIYHKIDGDWQEYYKNILDYPKGIIIINKGGEKYLNIFPSITLDENNCSETKIEFPNKDFDIIKTKIDKSNSNTIVTKVWHKGILKWEPSKKTERMFVIVK